MVNYVDMVSSCHLPMGGLSRHIRNGMVRLSWDVKQHGAWKRQTLLARLGKAPNLICQVRTLWPKLPAGWLMVQLGPVTAGSAGLTHRKKRIMINYH